MLTLKLNSKSLYRSINFSPSDSSFERRIHDEAERQGKRNEHQKNIVFVLIDIIRRW